MPQHPFPAPGPDSEEPASSALPPAAEEAGEGVGQGLYVCLPAEQVTLAGFAQNGGADTMAPGALLAAVVDTVTGPDGGGLAGCSDDQLLGIISGARRLAARAEWAQLAAIAEFAARHPRSTLAGEFAADELAFELHLTQPSAAGQMDYASTAAAGLPAAFAALAAGRIHPVQLRIIAEETSILSAADTARADAILSQQAPSQTFGELRRAARTLVLKLDPEAAKKRTEAARGDAHVRRFREDSGNAGLVARELPSDEVLASWHVGQRAQDLRAAGLPGTLRELRVRAYLDLLQERDSRDLPPAPAPAPGAGAGPSLAALVTLTIPWATWQGRSDMPGEAGGSGPLDGDDARDLAAAAARHPATRWCVTALHPDGTAAAHACLPGRHPPARHRPTGPPGRPLTLTAPIPPCLTPCCTCDRYYYWCGDTGV